MLAREGRLLADICRGRHLWLCANQFGGHEQLLVVFVDTPQTSLVRHLWLCANQFGGHEQLLVVFVDTPQTSLVRIETV